MVVKQKGNFLHRPEIESGSVPWQGTILPLDHRCWLTVVGVFHDNDMKLWVHISIFLREDSKRVGTVWAVILFP